MCVCRRRLLLLNCWCRMSSALDGHRSDLIAFGIEASLCTSSVVDQYCYLAFQVQAHWQLSAIEHPRQHSVGPYDRPLFCGERREKKREWHWAQYWNCWYWFVVGRTLWVFWITGSLLWICIGGGVWAVAVALLLHCCILCGLHLRISGTYLLLHEHKIDFTQKCSSIVEWEKEKQLTGYQ